MDLLQIVVLALVQGLTEFLPISSSAHLILVPHLTDWPDQGLAFDVAVHVGTLVAVVAYFRVELWQMLLAWFISLTGRFTPEARLAWAVIIGTLPVGIAGFLLKDWIESALRSPLVIAVATIGFGLLLWVGERLGKKVRDEHTIGWRDALLIGVGQALALIPGTSRSGATMTAGMLLGLTPTAAARFSFLLSIPVILLAGGLSALEVAEGNDPLVWGDLALGALLAAISAYFCIHYFLKLVTRIGMMPFIIYRLLLGVVLLLLFWPQG